MDTFDENNLENCKKFKNYLYDVDYLSKEFCIFNLEKVAKCLEKLEINEYETAKAEYLINIAVNLTHSIGIHWSTKDMIEWAVSLNLHKCLNNILVHYLNDKYYNTRIFSMDCIIVTATNLTYYDISADKNINSGLFETVLNILVEESFLDQEKLLDNNSISLYNSVIMFIYSTLKCKEDVNENLFNLNLVDRLKQHKRKLNDVLSTYGKNNEILQVTNCMLFCSIIKLLNDETIKEFEISKQMINYFGKMINKINKQAPENAIHENRKFYLTYGCHGSESYIYVDDILPCLIKLSSIDNVKEMILETNILVMIEAIFKSVFSQEVNNTDIKYSADLLISLCSSMNGKKFIKRNRRLLQLIETKSSELSNTSEAKHLLTKLIEKFYDKV